MSATPPRGRSASDLHVPPECRDMIRRGALVAVNCSGGKDSQAMMILLARTVPRAQLVVVHAPLGEVEWPGTIEHIEDTLPAGVPLIFARVASGKSLLEHVEERGMFPAPRLRWCTAGFYGELTIVRLSAYFRPDPTCVAPRSSVPTSTRNTHGLRSVSATPCRPRAFRFQN